MVFLNGQFVPEDQAKVSVFDRSFLLGDGLFETLSVVQGRLFRWREHWLRLERGAGVLAIPIPFGPETLEGHCRHLIRLSAQAAALVRITLSRGVGRRGYSWQGADQPVLVMSLHPVPHVDPLAPWQWRLRTARFRVAAGDPVAQLKTCSKIHHVLARSEAEASAADETLFLNTHGEFTEGAGSNLFWVEKGTVRTTPLASPALPGITRACVLELCARLGIVAAEDRCVPGTLRAAEGVFVTLTTLGVVEASSLDGEPLRRSPVTEQLHRAYQELVRVETSPPS